MVAPERGNFFLKTFENDRSMKTGNVNAFAKRKKKRERKKSVPLSFVVSFSFLRFFFFLSASLPVF